MREKEKSIIPGEKASFIHLGRALGFSWKRLWSAVKKSVVGGDGMRF